MFPTYTYKRRPTRTVMVGDLALGSAHPIRVQSMTISKTTDIAATVKETLELVRAGCELVRITVPTMRDAEALKDITASLRAEGCRVPLCADVHFMPVAAMRAADFVEKVRINPGNYADTKRFAVREYTDAEYNSELQRIYDKFKPLVLKLKENGKALRIGTNHGSLSDRIMNRFGDSPEGMVESALEFIRICQDLNYHDIVVSMKASNPGVMMAAYRLLAVRMAESNMDYPFHLGVTEAGDGEDGRVKSAIGIGALLLDGLGDTIRVSLTEDSIYEIPVCKALVAPFNRVHEGADPVKELGSLVNAPAPAEFSTEIKERRHVQPFKLNHFSMGPDTVLGGTARNPVRVEISTTTARGRRGEGTPEILHLRNGLVVENSDQGIPSDIFQIFLRDGLTVADALSVMPDDAIRPVEVVKTIEPSRAVEQLHSFVADVQKIANEHPNLRCTLRGKNLGYAYRYLDRLLRAVDSKVPLCLYQDCTHGQTAEDALVLAGRDAGSALAEGMGESLFLDDKGARPEVLTKWSFAVLQAARARISKTDFISCPSCGRTLFDLQTTTERIKSKMGHLTGVKIAIMGCIVNGPGEMADADFGYVGWGPGVINLYVGKECVERNIPEAEADQRLIDLIKRHGRWVDPALTPASPVVAEHSVSPAL